jgi:hypothetical protein
MAETGSNAPTTVTTEELFGEREHFWEGFYHFVWTVAACLVVLLVLMAYFLL